MKLRVMAKQGITLRTFNKLHHEESWKVRVIISDVQEAEYINIKNGNKYTLIGEVINATNANNGDVMFLYSDGKNFYVRNKDEFNEKFRKGE